MDNTLFFALFLQRLTEASLFRLRWCQSEPSPQSFSPLLYKLKVVRLVWVVVAVVVLVNTQEAQQAKNRERESKKRAGNCHANLIYNSSSSSSCCE